jgi:hypothetical protein
MVCFFTFEDTDPSKLVYVMGYTEGLREITPRARTTFPHHPLRPVFLSRPKPRAPLTGLILQCSPDAGTKLLFLAPSKSHSLKEPGTAYGMID